MVCWSVVFTAQRVWDSRKCWAISRYRLWYSIRIDLLVRLGTYRKYVPAHSLTEVYIPFWGSRWECVTVPAVQHFEIVLYYVMFLDDRVDLESPILDSARAVWTGTTPAPHEKPTTREVVSLRCQSRFHVRPCPSMKMPRLWWGGGCDCMRSQGA